MSTEPDGQVSLSGTLEKGLAVLAFFARAGEASPAAVARYVGLSRSATYRILDTLKDQDFLEVNPSSEMLRLGFRAAEIGMTALSGIDVVRLAPSYLPALVEAASETVFLAVVNDDEVVYVYREDGPRPVAMVSRIGSRRPLHCTALGKAYLSVLPRAERRALIGRLDLGRFMPRTITSIAGLEDEIEATKERGYAVDSVEVEEGVACVGAPVLDHIGRPVAAISIAGPTERVLPRTAALGRLVADAAVTLSRRLGYAARADRDAEQGEDAARLGSRARLGGSGGGRID
jgi:IclR family transcriptional regulator, acetate operon repressor